MKKLGIIWHFDSSAHKAFARGSLLIDTSEQKIVYSTKSEKTECRHPELITFLGALWHALKEVYPQSPLWMTDLSKPVEREGKTWNIQGDETNDRVFLKLSREDVTWKPTTVDGKIVFLKDHAEQQVISTDAAKVVSNAEQRDYNELDILLVRSYLIKQPPNFRIAFKEIVEVETVSVGCENFCVAPDRTVWKEIGGKLERVESIELFKDKTTDEKYIILTLETTNRTFEAGADWWNQAVALIEDRKLQVQIIRK